MDGVLDGIIAVMKEKYGRGLSSYAERFLAETIRKRMVALGIRDWAKYQEWLEDHAPEASALSDSLNIVYSEFFRNPLAFYFLERHFLNWAEHASKGSEFRVWSAGCSAGQEAYSVAMTLDHLAGPEGNFRIFATDISEAALEDARSGRYRADLIQNLRVGQLRDYFTRRESDYAIDPGLKGKISFCRYDLLDKSSKTPAESIYGDFDMIFCCNVLIYYRAESQKQIIRKLEKALSANGVLVVDPSERSLVESVSKLQRQALEVPVFQSSRKPHVTQSSFIP